MRPPKQPRRIQTDPARDRQIPPPDTDTSRERDGRDSHERQRDSKPQIESEREPAVDRAVRKTKTPASRGPSMPRTTGKPASERSSTTMPVKPSFPGRKRSEKDAAEESAQERTSGGAKQKRGLRRKTGTVPELPIPENRKKSSDPYVLTDKIEKKKQARRKQLLLRMAAFIAAIGLVAGAIWLLFFSSFFVVKEDKIELTIDDPAGVVNEEQVREIARTATGTPVLRLSAAEIEGQLEENPAVLDASVSSSFPNGMTVDITAREPVACVGDEGTCVGISEDAVQLEISDEVRATLPRLTMDLDGDHAKAQLTGLLDAVATMPEDVRGRVQTATISSSGLIEFQLDSGVIKWGPSEENEKKARIIAVLLDQPAGTYDVTLPDAPVTY